MPVGGGCALLERLRAETRTRHAALDGAIGPEVSRSRESYGRFLDASFVASAALEASVQRRLGPNYPVQRAAKLRADLEDLGVAVPAMPAAFEVESEAEAFGCAYVLEGSALGGLVLATAVRRLLGDDVPTRYLVLRGPETAQRWRWFLDELNAFGTRATDEEHAGASRAAGAAFDLYGTAMVRATARP